MTKMQDFEDRFVSKDEKIIFYAILLINITFLFATRFYPSMDGPAHLYNSNILKHLLLSDGALDQFYKVNHFPVPNWTGHFILAFFRLFLPAWLSEKCLLVLYVSGMALSFRYLINTLRPENTALSIFIFPFTYSFLFHLGFYNYSLSFIFFFFTLAYWINEYKNNHFSLYLITGLLLLATYFSNVLTFAFLGITLGCTILLFEAGSESISSKKYIILAVNRLKWLALCALPSLLLVYFFFNSVSFPESQQQYASGELFRWINEVRSLIVYSYTGEKNITAQFFYILVFLLLFSFIVNENRVRLKSMFINSRQAIAYFSVLLSVVLFFVMPNDSSAGMMSDRLSLMFFILLMILVITQKLPTRVRYVFSMIIIFLHLMLLTKHTVTIHELDQRAQLINQSARYMEANKVVLPVNLSDNWLEPHFSNYLGADKPLVILENYEAKVGWFPIRWNPQAPRIVLADRPLVKGVSWYDHSKNGEEKSIDYVFIYGDLSKKNDEQWKELNDLLAQAYRLSYESKDRYIQIYQKN